MEMSDTDAVALYSVMEAFKQRAELRSAALPFLPPHSALCVPIINGVLTPGTPVTRKTCKCDDKTKRLRTALEAW